MWRRNKLLSEFLANSHLPEVIRGLACQVVRFKPGDMHIYPGICLTTVDYHGEPHLRGSLKFVRPFIVLNVIFLPQ